MFMLSLNVMIGWGDSTRMVNNKDFLNLLSMVNGFPLIWGMCSPLLFIIRLLTPESESSMLVLTVR